MEIGCESPGCSGTHNTVRESKMNCDEDGREQPDEKKNSVTPDLARKMRVLCFLIHVHYWILKKVQVTTFNDIDLIAEVTSKIFTLHTHTCQALSDLGKVSWTGKLKLKGKVVDLTMAEAQGIFNSLKDIYGITYGTKTKTESDVGAISDLLSLSAMYEGRIKEMSTDIPKIVIKDGNKTFKAPLHMFGLEFGASIYMSGANLKLTMQSSMKPSLGPLTVAVQLCMSTTTKVQQSWKEAFVQSFCNVPKAAEIADILAGSKVEHKDVLHMLYLFCLVGAPGCINKAAIPFAFFLRLATESRQAREAFEKQAMVSPEILHPAIQYLNYSGPGIWHFWHACADLGSWTMLGRAKMTSEMAAQICTHAVFGSHGENLALLKLLTGRDFMSKREMGDCFFRKGTERKVVKFGLIKFKYVSKLSSGSQTNLDWAKLDPGYGQCSRSDTVCEVEATHQERKLKLMRILRATLDNVIKEIKKTGSISHGTSCHYEYNSNDPKSYGVPTDIVFEIENSKFFFG